MYVIICVASTGECADYGPRKSWIFRSQRDCTVFAGKLYGGLRDKIEKEGRIVIDGTSFCLRFMETKET